MSHALVVCCFFFDKSILESVFFRNWPCFSKFLSSLLILSSFFYRISIVVLNSNFSIHYQMAAKPLTTEAIALTEKKMDMTLGVLNNRTFWKMTIFFSLALSHISNIHHLLILIDDIIKMSKNTKNKKPRRVLVSICFQNLFFCYLLCCCFVIFVVVTLSLDFNTLTEQKSKVFK